MASLRTLIIAFGLTCFLTPVWAESPPVPTCHGTLYLTLDTGSMKAAETIAKILQRRHILATFFVANEPTWRGDHALDQTWQSYWQARVAEGHQFGNHTWYHATLVTDLASGSIQTRGGDHAPKTFDQAAFCLNLRRVDQRFQALTGRPLAPLWRAPGGKLTPNAVTWAADCGFPYPVGWSAAGFLGDELSSESYPNALLLKRALAHMRNGNILMMHLGIRSRHDPFVNILEPLLKGLQERGFCFATLPVPPPH